MVQRGGGVRPSGLSRQVAGVRKRPTPYVEGFRPSRALGQNFVVDPNTLSRIARLASVGEGDRVVEVGAGTGGLTRALSETGAEVVALEKDRRLIGALNALASSLGSAFRVSVVEADAMDCDWDALLGADPGWVLVGNLPYNIATPLVVSVLEGVPQVGRLFVMVQKEVAHRLAASPGDPSYGAVSVKVAYWAHARVAGSVSRSVFRPRPSVESALVSITRRETVAVPQSVAGYASICRLVEAAFSQRRKMLRSSLAGFVDYEAFERAGIAPQRRPEDLSVEEWGRLAGWLA